MNTAAKVSLLTTRMIVAATPVLTGKRYSQDLAATVTTFTNELSVYANDDIVDFDRLESVVSRFENNTNLFLSGGRIVDNEIHSIDASAEAKVAIDEYLATVALASPQERAGKALLTRIIMDTIKSVGCI